MYDEEKMRKYDERMDEFIANFDIQADLEEERNSYHYNFIRPMKIERILNDHYNAETSKRVCFDGVKSSLEYLELNKIKITQRAIDKGKYISHSLCDIAQGDYEIYFYLTGDGDVIDDIYIAQDQVVRPSLCSVSPDGGMDSSFEIIDLMNKKIMGWSHSHGGFPLFHSNVDVGTLRQFASAGRLCVLNLHDDVDGLEDKLHTVRYSSSLVFNKYLWGADDMPFAGISLFYNNYGGVATYHINEKVNLEFIPSEPFSPEEYAEVDRQIIDRVTLYDRGPLKDLVMIDEGEDKADIDE
jgi:hypothetical protein